MAEIDPAQDGQLELKKRARRRLVGAVALALLAVIVLPMVMDQEPKPLNQDIQIRIPSQEAGGPPLSAVAAPQPVAPKPATPPAAATAPSIRPASPEKKSEPLPLPQPVNPVDQAKPTTPEVRSPAPEVKADAAKPEALHDQWVVQLGAYQDSGNVKNLLAKIKALGYPSYTERIDTALGPRTRVRCGPFATRAAAEKAQVRLKKISAGGPQGGIVAQKQ